MINMIAVKMHSKFPPVIIAWNIAVYVGLFHLFAKTFVYMNIKLSY